MKILDMPAAILSSEGEVKFKSSRFKNVEMPHHLGDGFFTSGGEDFSIQEVELENVDDKFYVVEPLERSNVAKQISRIMIAIGVIIAIASGMYLIAMLLSMAAVMSYSGRDVLTMFSMQSQIVWWVVLAISTEAYLFCLLPLLVSSYCFYLFMGDRWKS